MGKTDGVLNVVGHRLKDDPVPILYVGPTRSNLEKAIEPRFLAMVRLAKELRERLRQGHRPTKTYEHISGVLFRPAWADSITELASEPAASSSLMSEPAWKTMSGAKTVLLR
jgi:hypothetical protein